MQTDKLVWILDENQSGKETFKSILGIRHKLRFFSKVRELSNALSSVTTTSVPTIVICSARKGDREFLDFLESDRASFFLKFPVIVISEIDDLDLLRFFYDCGATQCMVWPIHNNELIVKIEQIISGFKSKFDIHELLGPKYAKLDLTYREAQILSEFLKSENSTISQTLLTDKVWMGKNVQKKNIEVHIHYLRKKLKSVGQSIEYIGGNRWRLIPFDECAEC